MAAPAGIPTVYAGIRFRSRLEARWAAFFTEIGWTWEYEPFDLEGYIPDFLIQGDHPLLVEIGHCVTQADYERKTAKINGVADQWEHDVLVLGSGPLPRLAISYDDRAHPAGWLGEFYRAGDQGEAEPAGFAWGPAIWAQGPDPFDVAVFHDFMNWGHRPWQGSRNALRHTEDILDPAWARAVNATQWRAA